MGKRFYIASGFVNKDIVSNVAKALKEKGFSHTYDWTKNEKANSIEDLREIGTAELLAVRESDFVLIILPGGKGTHVELGIALACGKKVYLYSADPQAFLETTFYQVAGIKQCTGEMDQVIDEIIKKESGQLL